MRITAKRIEESSFRKDGINLNNNKTRMTTSISSEAFENKKIFTFLPFVA